jgi:hypothetical protein
LGSKLGKNWLVNANVRGSRAHPMSEAFKVCIFPYEALFMQSRNFTHAQIHTGREMRSQPLVAGELATISSRDKLR